MRHWYPRECAECQVLSFHCTYDPEDWKWRHEKATPYCSDACLSAAAERESADVQERGYPS